MSSLNDGSPEAFLAKLSAALRGARKARLGASERWGRGKVPLPLAFLRVCGADQWVRPTRALSAVILVT